jgi:hypothetical protein
LGDEFKEKLFSMMDELKELLNEGGVSMDNEIITSEEVVEEVAAPAAEEPVVEEGNTEFASKKDEEEDKKDSEEKKCPKCGKPVSECECEDEDDEEKKNKFAKDEEDKDEDKEEKCPECGKTKEECTCKDKKEDKKDKYNLNEIPEYMELVENYNTLQSQYSALETEVTSLREFKVAAERKDKEAMIAGFYMLSDEDKKDVIDNIDTYSLDDIEAKLSIICVRNKVSFDLDDDNKDKEEVVTYSVNADMNDDNVPAFIKAMRDVAKNM